MNGRSRGRRDNLGSRRAWTDQLNRFANQRDAVLDLSLQINPGGTLRDLLRAWGYSASARGRKAKDAQDKGAKKPSRERIQLALEDLFGKKPTPIPSLNPKLAGRTDVTVKDACRIVAALLVSWPEPLQALESVDQKERLRKAQNLAELFIRELLSELSGGRSRDWSAADMEIRVFRLVNEERIGVNQFIEEAGIKDGALIVAGARNILIGPHPVDTIRKFHEVTSGFISGDGGILIFVFDAGFFEAGELGFNLLDNIGRLSTAITAFALFETYDNVQPIQAHEVDWSRWRKLSRRCCVVIRKPPLIDPASGALVRHDKVDDYVARWQPEQQFERLNELRGFVRFESGHVLPWTYPAEFGETETLLGRDLYWDVTVRTSTGDPEGSEVRYFIPPPPSVAATTGRTHGRPPSKKLPIEEDLFYVVRRDSPGSYYDDAQRTVYMAARARLNLDSGDLHLRNLNAASALRQLGYEVWPISIMLSIFPAMLNSAIIEYENREKSVTEM